MEANEIIANACANRAFIYQYLWRVFSDVPDETLIETTLRTAREQFELFWRRLARNERVRGTLR